MSVTRFREFFRSLLELAHDIRKFEIELYWKRAGYFWALIAAAFAGYFALQRRSPTGFLPLLISCVGFFLALGWYLVNRGSKYWQENWERHVDVLETHVVGPLYKTTLSKELFSFWKFWKGYPYSVSKVNQLISLFVVLVWLGLVAAALPALPWRDQLRSLAPWLIVGVTALFAVLAFWKGQSSHPGEARRVHFCESPLESAGPQASTNKERS